MIRRKGHASTVTKVRITWTAKKKKKGKGGVGESRWPKWKKAMRGRPEKVFT